MTRQPSGSWLVLSLSICLFRVVECGEPPLVETPMFPTSYAFVGFLTRIAQGTENADDWERVKDAHLDEHKHPLRYFDVLLDSTSLPLLDEIGRIRGVVHKTEKGQEMPFALIWRILDRSKPIRVSSLSLGRFFYTGLPMADDNPLRPRVGLMLSMQDWERAERARKRAKSKHAPPQDALLYVQLALYAKLGKDLQPSDAPLPDGWAELARTELRARAQRPAADISQWILKEAARRAFLQASQELPTPVWDDAKFKKWFEANGPTPKQVRDAGR